MPDRDERKPCGFCKGKPVGDAASWADGIPRRPAPCPRCGETTERGENAGHELEVVSSFVTGGWTGICSCGWTGEKRGFSGTAWDDCRKHLVAVMEPVGA